MATLTITRGLPGSGKSTWARQYRADNAEQDVNHSPFTRGARDLAHRQTKPQATQDPDGR